MFSFLALTSISTLCENGRGKLVRLSIPILQACAFTALTASNAGHHTGGDIRYPNAEAVENLTDTQKSYIKNQVTNDDGSVTVTFEQRRWTGFRRLDYYLEKYAEVYDNLKVHDPSYPTPEYLKSVTKHGNIKVVGDLQEITEGSEYIKKNHP